MEHPIITFIGAGNMATSLIHGLMDTGYKSNHIIVSNPTQAKLTALEQRYQIQTTTDNCAAAAQAEVLILAVKPKILPEVAKQVAPYLSQKKPIILSLATGITLENLQKWLGKYSIIRCMPNTPALVGCAVTGLIGNKQTTAAQKNIAESILRAVGTTSWIATERQMDIVTALSGCGPAYFFLMIEALQDAAETLGLPAEQAKLLTLGTALGAARMALESELDPAQLRQQVTSPGGATERALEVLETGAFRELMFNALVAATTRAEEIAGLPLNINKQTKR